MEVKLIKTGNDFLLKDENGETLAITSGTIKGRILSLKNCEAIERGYDLDELADRMIIREENITPEIKRWLIIYFKLGFQKCLEILDDKKFSEMDMLNFSEFVSEKYINQYKFLRDKNLKGFFTTSEILKEYQSLQQTEWDVEVEMVRQRCHLSLRDWVDEDENGEFPISIAGAFSYRKVPKLDADGCLILKKI